MRSESLKKAYPELNAWRLLVGITVVAACLRLPLIFQPLWLDEVWSYFFAQEAENFWEIVAGITHSNNHILNTLQMRVVGFQSNLFLYRLFPFACGVATVYVIGLAGARVNAETGIFSALIATASLPMVLYSAEARGYGPAMLFSVLAFLLVRILSEERVPWDRRLPIFWLACVLGALSHITFVFVFAGIGCAWLFEAFANRRPIRDLFLSATRLFALPGLLISLLVLNQFFGLRPESIHQRSWATSYVTMFADSIGLDGWSLPLFVSAAVVVAVFVLAAILDKKDGRAVLIISVPLPLLVFSLYEAPYMFSRYFIVLTPFFVLAAGLLLARVWRSSARGGPAIALLLMALIVAGSALDYLRLLAHGRGDYISAVEDMYAAHGDSDFSVGSDHDFRNYTMLRFYTRFIPNAERMSYVSSEEHEKTLPDFMLVHRFDPMEAVVDAFLLDGDTRYSLSRSYPHSGVSGWTWYLYRKQAPEGVSHRE